MPTIARRFCVVYFTAYSLITHLAGGVLLSPFGAFPALGQRWPLNRITFWSAEHLFGIPAPLVYSGNSGDTVFHWIQTGWVLVLALMATSIWTWIDRRPDLAALTRPFHLFIRFVVAAQMFYYGMAKIIPAQFPPPSLVTLIEPIGTFSLSDLLWAFIGASTPYQIVTGCAETLAGLLLLLPRTATLGALLGLVDMTQVFVLNMTYDFGLKLVSLHLLLMCLFLLAPDLRRLAQALVPERPRATRTALVAQMVFGLYLLVMFTSIAWRSWHAPGGGASPRSALYGIWAIDELSIDGEVRAPSLNEYDRRWRRVVFDAPDVMVFQRVDDSLAHFGVSIDVASRTLALTKGNSRSWSSAFVFSRPARDRLVLEGEMDDQKIRMRLHLVELDTFRLLNSRFRWIRPPDPFAG